MGVAIAHRSTIFYFLLLKVVVTSNNVMDRLLNLNYVSSFKVLDK